ncbi:MAG: FAD:protein FMN transferase [Thermoanaerobaculia bacterium]
MLLRVLLTVLSTAAITAGLSAEPVRMATPAFGTSAEVEVRDLPRAEAEAAARRALQIIFEISQLADPSSSIPGGVGELNAAAGQGPWPIAEHTTELLLRGLQICIWSSGAHGPLGGELKRLWTASGRFPDSEELRLAVASANCSLLGLAGGDPPRGELWAGSRIDSSWLARGFAIDLAVERLEKDGVDNVWLEIGPVQRALGKGPQGLGWPLSLPPAPDSTEPVDRLWLMDQAATVVTRIEDDSEAPIIDQRTGISPRGVVMVAVVANQAWDAEVLAASLFILGLRDGQLRLGGYSPRPSIFWLLGAGAGTPLQSTYRWSNLRRMPRR